MPYEFKYRKTVEFAETDMAGIAHFANFFRYMEMAEHAFFRSMGFSVHPAEPGARVGWPRVNASCEFKKPIHFEDIVEIHLLVREKKEKALSYEFILSKVTGDRLDEVARGALTTVCIAFDETGNRMRAIPIPADIASQIEVAPV